MKRLLAYSFLLIIIASLWSSCSTTNHAPIVKMAYEDLTSHYNAYFNANEKYKAVMQNLLTSHKDNFDNVIPLEYYTNPQDAASAKGELDEVVAKSTASIQFHNLSNWADDHFLLIAKAHYVMGDYDKALVDLKYITTEYKEGVDYVKEMKRKGKSAKPTLKKKKAKKPKFEKVLNDKGQLVLQKIDERPKKELFVHEPARAEALVWLAKTYTAQKSYEQAASVIQYARSDDKFYKNYDKILELADADNFLRQKDYNNAIIPLEKFLTMTKKKKERVRPLFVLAQLYEIKGDYKKAADYYKDVLKSRPNYDMEFYAKIKRANVGRKGGAPAAETKKLLASMARDGKYKDYLDQIYYQLAEIVLSEKNRPEAKKYYAKSVAASTNNADQKALSYLKMAEMDFEDEQYESSKKYYDSTLISLSKNTDNYAVVEQRSKILTKLVDNLSIIKMEDSLQRIANMSPTDREKFFKKLEADKAKEEASKAASKGTSAPAASAGDGNGSTDWYYYSAAAKNNGYNEFIRKWGRRKLEDNWRRKDKSVSLDAVDNSTPVDTAKEAPTDNSTNPMMDKLPLTAEAKSTSNNKIAEAMYNVGLVYKDDLHNYRKATTTFENLLKKYPDNKLKLESYYQLYLLAKLQKNSAKEQQYKDLILAEFPTSKIANFLKNPAYFEELKNEENKLNAYYENVYKSYLAGNFAEIETKSKIADVQFSPNPLKPKFELLTALSMAKQNRLSDYVQQLNKIINTYKNTPEQATAESLLSDLNQSKLPMKDLSKEIPAPVAPRDTTTIIKDTIPTTKPTTLVIDSTAIKNAAKLKMDSLKSAAKDTIVKPAPKVAPKDTVTKPKTTTVKTDTTKVKPAPKVAPKDTITKPKTTTVKTDTTKVKPAPKVAPKDTITKPKTTTVKTDTTKVKPAPKVAPKDTVTKPKTTTVKTDTTKVKPAPKVAPKDTVTKPKTTTVKTDTTKVKPAPKVAPKDTVTKPKTAAVDTNKTKVTTVVAPAILPIDTTDAEPIYGISNNAPHYIVIYFKNYNAYSQSVIDKLMDYCTKNQSGNQLLVKGIVIDNSNKAIQIKTFGNKNAAATFLDKLKNDKKAIDLNTADYFIGEISALNYSTLINSKRIGNYIQFYNTNHTK